MREIDELIPRVLQYASGCAEPTILHHLRDAATELCTRIRCWRHVDKFKVHECDHGQLLLNIPNGAELHRLEWARCGGADLEPVEYSSHYEDQNDAPGQPRYITQINPGTFKVIPDPVDHVEVTLSMFLKPSLSATHLPDHIVEEFGRIIVQGALGSLLLLPNEPFTNMDLGLFNQTQFNQALDRNFDYAKKGQQRARIRTKPNFF